MCVVGNVCAVTLFTVLPKLRGRMVSKHELLSIPEEAAKSTVATHSIQEEALSQFPDSHSSHHPVVHSSHSSYHHNVHSKRAEERLDQEILPAYYEAYAEKGDKEALAYPEEIAILNNMPGFAIDGDESTDEDARSQLDVTVHKAKELIGADMGGTSDCFGTRTGSCMLIVY